VGRSLAFDPFRGRLWVICRACRSWNLAPLLERWEPLEELERLFERVRVEASSENVALGRARDGTHLLRVGRVERREFAFWRYTRRLTRRSKRAAGIAYATLGGPLVLGMAAGVSMWLTMPATAALAAGLLQWRDRRCIFKTDDGRVVRMGDASRIQLKPERDDAEWCLEIPRRREPITLTGGEALRALRAALLERRALEGEMGLLEREWREAEELAAISDDLLVPATVETWLRRHDRPFPTGETGGFEN
jgi:hypothetical protein